MHLHKQARTQTCWYIHTARIRHLYQACVRHNLSDKRIYSHSFNLNFFFFFLNKLKVSYLNDSWILYLRSMSSFAVVYFQMGMFVCLKEMFVCLKLSGAYTNVSVHFLSVGPDTSQ